MDNHVALTPESLDIATAYIQYGSARDVAEQLQIPEHTVIQLLERKDVRDYINGVYLDRGYRNKNRIADLLDKMIESKLEEAVDTGMYTKEDLFKLVEFSHKVRQDELKRINPDGPTVQIANFGGGNYGELMDRLLRKS